MPKSPLHFRALRQVQGSRTRPTHLLPRVLVRRHRLRPLLPQRPLRALVIWTNAMNRMTYEISLQGDFGFGWVDLYLRCYTILPWHWVATLPAHQPGELIQYFQTTDFAQINLMHLFYSNMMHHAFTSAVSATTSVAPSRTACGRCWCRWGTTATPPPPWGTPTSRSSPPDSRPSTRKTGYARKIRVSTWPLIIIIYVHN